jgi:hypothetical protein
MEDRVHPMQRITKVDGRAPMAVGPDSVVSRTVGYLVPIDALQSQCDWIGLAPAALHASAAVVIPGPWRA